MVLVLQEVSLDTSLQMYRELSPGVSVQKHQTLLMSGFAGNRLGAIRDAKGKSVAQVFSGMESSQKAEVGTADLVAAS